MLPTHCLSPRSPTHGPKLRALGLHVCVPQSLQGRVWFPMQGQPLLAPPSQSASSPRIAQLSNCCRAISPSHGPQICPAQVCVPCWQLPVFVPQARTSPSTQAQSSLGIPSAIRIVPTHVAAVASLGPHGSVTGSPGSVRTTRLRSEPTIARHRARPLRGDRAPLGRLPALPGLLLTHARAPASRFRIAGVQAAVAARLALTRQARTTLVRAHRCSWRRPVRWRTSRACSPGSPLRRHPRPHRCRLVCRVHSYRSWFRRGATLPRRTGSPRSGHRCSRCPHPACRSRRRPRGPPRPCRRPRHHSHHSRVYRAGILPGSVPAELRESCRPPPPSRSGRCPESTSSSLRQRQRPASTPGCRTRRPAHRAHSSLRPKPATSPSASAGGSARPKRNGARMTAHLRSGRGVAVCPGSATLVRSCARREHCSGAASGRSSNGRSCQLSWWRARNALDASSQHPSAWVVQGTDGRETPKKADHTASSVPHGLQSQTKRSSSRETTSVVQHRTASGRRQGSWSEVVETRYGITMILKTNFQGDS